VIVFVDKILVLLLLFAGWAEKNRGCDSVAEIIVRCPARGVSRLFWKLVLEWRARTRHYERRWTQIRSVAGLPRWIRGGRWPVTERVIVSSYSR